MIKQIILITMLAWMVTSSVTAQTITKGFEMGELIRIGYTYRQEPYLSFNIKYQYADSASPSTILEEVNGQFKLHEGRYWAMLDSAELVQGNNYNVTVFHDEKVISVSRAKYMDDRILQVPALDTLFNNYIDSMNISGVSDSVNLLKIYFKHNMPYSGYEMRYNPVTYLVNSMQYYLRDVSGDSTGSGKSLIKVTMSNYSLAAIPEDVFLESKFIYRDGSFYTRPDYSDYELHVDGDF